jgi:hypothetical protein
LRSQASAAAKWAEEERAAATSAAAKRAEEERAAAALVRLEDELMHAMVDLYSGSLSHVL